VKGGITLYTLKNCDTCRQAAKWLAARSLSFEERAIRETPPTVAELKIMLAALGGERRRLFNTSGRDFRELKLGDKVDGMTEAEALQLLAGNGNLVKRPFLLTGKTGLVGFDGDEWHKAMAAR
jgi:arsenate reductase